MPTTTGYLDHTHPYVQFGTGDRPLVVIPGLADSLVGPIDGIRAWLLRWSLRRYTADRRVYLVRRPTGLPTDASIASMADGYAAALQSRFDSPVDVVGISMGSCIAQELASAHPDVVRRLVVGTAACRLSEEGKAIAARWRDFAADHNWEALYREAADLTFSDWRGSLYGKLWLLPTDLVFDDPPVSEDVSISLDALSTFDACDRVGDIESPTLLIGGDEDPFFDERTMIETAEAIPDAQLFLFRRSGHGAFAEHRRAFDRAAIDFLDDRQ